MTTANPLSSEPLIVEKEPPFAWIKLNRPEHSNALNTQLLRDLKLACEDMTKDDSIHLIGVIGSGRKVFCAGADLAERRNMTNEQVVDYHTLIQSTFSALENLPQVVIAVLNGSAYGGGTELALCCDLRITVPHASLRLTEVRLGIIPGAGGTQRLPRLIGVSKAKEMIYFAAPLTAKRGFELGLIHNIVDTQFEREGPFDPVLMNATKVWATDLSEAAPLSLRQAKVAINRGIEQDLQSGLAIETECYMRLLNTKDRLEGLQAFAEKRKPIYRGE